MTFCRFAISYVVVVWLHKIKLKLNAARSRKQICFDCMCVPAYFMGAEPVRRRRSERRSGEARPCGVGESEVTLGHPARTTRGRCSTALACTVAVIAICAAFEAGTAT